MISRVKAEHRADLIRREPTEEGRSADLNSDYGGFKLTGEQIEASDLSVNWRESPPPHPLSLSSATILRSGQGAAYC